MDDCELSQRATEQCGIYRSRLVVRLSVWFSSCHWKCSVAVAVLQKRVSTNNIKPIFSLVLRSRLSSRACYRPCLDSHTIHSASKSSHFEASYKLAVDSLNYRHSVQLMLCFYWPIYHCHSLSFSLSGNHKQVKMLRSDYNGVVNLTFSSFLQDFGRK